MAKISFTEKIYTYYIDFVGHVNNLIYIQWMENGRMRFMEEIGFPIDDLAHSKGIVPVITSTSIQYKKPFFLHNKVTIEMWISKQNNASVIIEFRFYNESGELCSTGQQKGLFIDRKTMRPARMTEEQKRGFAKYLHNQ